jgi:hypothetical protein
LVAAVIEEPEVIINPLTASGSKFADIDPVGTTSLQICLAAAEAERSES